MPDQESAAPDGQEPTSTEGQEPGVDQVEPEGQEPRQPRDEATVKQLRREAAQSRARAKEAETKLQELLDANKSESERLADAKAQAEVRATQAELKLMRYEVAAAHGLELRAAAFLTGENLEELEASADELTKLLAEQAKPAPATTPSFDGGARLTPAETKSPEEAHNDLVIRAIRQRGA